VYPRNDSRSWSRRASARCSRACVRRCSGRAPIAPRGPVWRTGPGGGSGVTRSHRPDMR